MLLVTIWQLGRDGSPTDVRRSANFLLAVVIAQAFIGYVQYLSGVPEVLVAVHIVGAVSVWVATLQFVLRLQQPRQRTRYPQDLVELTG